MATAIRSNNYRSLPAIYNHQSIRCIPHTAVCKHAKEKSCKSEDRWHTLLSNTLELTCRTGLGHSPPLNLRAEESRRIYHRFHQLRRTFSRADSNPIYRREEHYHCATFWCDVDKDRWQQRFAATIIDPSRRSITINLYGASPTRQSANTQKKSPTSRRTVGTPCCRTLWN